MQEKDAVFVIGKRFSVLRNSGEDLPVEHVRVGNSMVLIEELADEYDKHFPPGPRRVKQETNRVLQYELTFIRGGDHCSTEHGLRFSIEGRPINVLESHTIFLAYQVGNFLELISTNNSNRFDTIAGHDMTLVIDKLEEKLSVKRARFEVGHTFCDENPISGKVATCINREPWGACLDLVYFPFVPFADFWRTWNAYVECRKRQVCELIECKPEELFTPMILDSNARPINNV